MYTYPGSGGFQSQTSTGGGGGGMDDLTSFYREMAERRMGQMDEDRRRRMQAENRARFSKPAPTMGGPQMNPADQHLADLQRGLEIQKIQTAMRPAPQKMLTGPQINPGWVDDPSAMSGVARQMYLPQGSGMSGDINANSYDARSAEEQNRPTLPPEADTRADFGALGSYGKYAPIGEEERRRREQGGR